MRLLGLRLRSWLGWGLHPNELRVRSALVRVTYQPVVERVLDVAYAEEPVEAVPLDGPEHT